jgi:hypothetical protein
MVGIALLGDGKRENALDKIVDIGENIVGGVGFA